MHTSRILILLFCFSDISHGYEDKDSDRYQHEIKYPNTYHSKHLIFNPQGGADQRSVVKVEVNSATVSKTHSISKEEADGYNEERIRVVPNRHGISVQSPADKRSDIKIEERTERESTGIKGINKSTHLVEIVHSRRSDDKAGVEIPIESSKVEQGDGAKEEEFEELSQVHVSSIDKLSNHTDTWLITTDELPKSIISSVPMTSEIDNGTESRVSRYEEAEEKDNPDGSRPKVAYRRNNATLLEAEGRNEAMLNEIKMKKHRETNGCSNTKIGKRSQETITSKLELEKLNGADIPTIIEQSNKTFSINKDIKENSGTAKASTEIEKANESREDITEIRKRSDAALSSSVQLADIYRPIEKKVDNGGKTFSNAEIGKRNQTLTNIDEHSIQIQNVDTAQSGNATAEIKQSKHRNVSRIINVEENRKTTKSFEDANESSIITRSGSTETEATKHRHGVTFTVQSRSDPGIYKDDANDTSIEGRSYRRHSTWISYQRQMSDFLIDLTGEMLDLDDEKLMDVMQALSAELRNYNYPTNKEFGNIFKKDEDQYAFERFFDYMGDTIKAIRETLENINKDFIKRGRQYFASKLGNFLTTLDKTYEPKTKEVFDHMRTYVHDYGKGTGDFENLHLQMRGFLRDVLFDHVKNVEEEMKLQLSDILTESIMESPYPSDIDYT